MLGITNAALDNAYALGVSFPKGSICTCTNGLLTYKADTTDGYSVFDIPVLGSWQVSWTDNAGHSASKTVIILTEDKEVHVELVYTATLFDGSNGGDNAALTGGWASSGNGNSSTMTSTYIEVANGGSENLGSWYGGTSYYKTVKAVDLSPFKTATIVVGSASSNSTFSVGGRSITINNAGTFSISIEDLTSGVVQISATRKTESWSKYRMRATKIYLH